MSDGRMGIEESADIVPLLSEAQRRDALHYLAETPDQRHVGGGYVVTVRELTRTRNTSKFEVPRQGALHARRVTMRGAACARVTRRVLGTWRRARSDDAMVLERIGDRVGGLLSNKPSKHNCASGHRCRCSLVYLEASKRGSRPARHQTQ